jgi:hypothetical protein
LDGGTRPRRRQRPCIVARAPTTRDSCPSAETASATQELLSLSEYPSLAVLSVAPSGSPQTTRLAAQRHVSGTRRQASGATGSWCCSRLRSQAAYCSRFQCFISAVSSVSCVVVDVTCPGAKGTEQNAAYSPSSPTWLGMVTDRSRMKNSFRINEPIAMALPWPRVSNVYRVARDKARVPVSCFLNATRQSPLSLSFFCDKPIYTKSYSLCDISPSGTHNRGDRSPGSQLCYNT